MKIIKKLLAISLVLTVMIAISQTGIMAASFSASANKTSVEANGSFSITVNVDGAGKFSITGNNATPDTSSIWCDNSCSFNVKAGASGTSSVNIVAVDATGNDETPITGTKTVSVSIKAQSNQQPSSPPSSNSSGTSQSNNSSNTTVAKSGDNALKSLTVSEGTLFPEFKQDVYEYTLELHGNSTKKLLIEASANSSKATVSGNGEFELPFGESEYEIKVVAENGNPQIYKIKVNYIEEPVLRVPFGNYSIGILSIPPESVSMTDFETKTIKYNDKDIEVLSSNLKDLVLVYGEDETGEKAYYIFEEKEGIVAKYETVAVSGYNIVVLTPSDEQKQIEGFKYGQVEIGGKKVNGWNYLKDGWEHYKLIYGMDETGQTHYFQYDSETDTIQIIGEEQIQAYQQFGNNSSQSLLIICFVAIGVISLITIACVIRISQLKKKIKSENDEQEVMINKK